MSTTVYLEGGGPKESTQSRLRQGFSDYCKRINPALQRFRIVASGARNQAFEDFELALAEARPHETIALLVDSECAVTAGNAISHLADNDHWKLHTARTSRIFLMVQCMESWFLADRTALANFYDGGFRAGSLPGSPQAIEDIRKQDVATGLKNATEKTRSKGVYRKIDHGAILLGLINPALVERASKYAKEFHDFLRSR